MRPEFKKNKRGPLTIWAEPEPKENYVISVDAASGLPGATDYTVVKIMRAQDMYECACWRSNKVPPWEVGSKVVCLGYHYNTALIGYEDEKHGVYIGLYLEQSGYPNIYMRQRYGKVPKPSSKAAPVLSTEMGWRTDVRTRPIMFSTGRRVLDEGTAQINSPNQLREMAVIAEDPDTGRPTHPKGMNDDEVLAWLIGLMMREYAVHRGGIVVKPSFPRTPAEEEEAYEAQMIAEMSRPPVEPDDDWGDGGF